MLACVDIFSFPLQLVLIEHKDWCEDPVVVVEAHKPLASILWANKHAQAHRIHRGMKFGSAQALTARLRASVVSPKTLEESVSSIFKGLLNYSPYVEPSKEWPGLFWLDPSGMESLFGDLKTWAGKVHQYVQSLGFVASVVVGFTRFSVFGIARTSVGPTVLKSKIEEKRWAKRVPLARLHLSPKLLHEIQVLGIRNLGDFLRLPASELRTRYGEEAYALHQLATDKKWMPLRPKTLLEPIFSDLEVDPPDDNRTRLLFGLKMKLHQVLQTLTERCEAAVAIHLELHLYHAPIQKERIETAGPTLDVVQISDLIRLRLSSLELGAPVERIRLIVDSVRVHPQQISLLQSRRRDLEAVSRALARIKASFGRSSVVRPVLRDAILPEARYAWEPTVRLEYPEPQEPEAQIQPLVRHVFQKPVLLPDVPKQEPERWLGNHGAVEQMLGPYRVNGGWWLKRVSRDYYFIETKTKELLWVFYDAPRRRWVLHGMVG